MANSRITAECSTALEKLLSAKAGPSDAEFIRMGFLTLLSRSPRPSEVEACRESLAILSGESKDATVSSAGPRARALMLQALMNHNDFVTLR